MNLYNWGKINKTNIEAYVQNKDYKGLLNEYYTMSGMSLTQLSKSFQCSRRMRWAIFLPIPWATVRAFSSPVMMAVANPSGVVAERMESAALGPTPETPMSS